MNRKKTFLFVLLLSVVTVCTHAQTSLSNLRVMGKDLVDENGGKVVLHGVMDTPNRYFNGWRWQGWKPGYGDEDVQPCLDYFDKLFTAMTDHGQGAYATVFRLHLDPCWTNDPNKTSTGSGQEDDISRFSSSRLVKYWKSLYSKLMTDAIGHGLYVVMRPPGVCPHSIKVGDDYQQYLITVWKTITSASLVKDNAGLVSIELANEPVDVYDSNGKKNSPVALRDYFQPIVDVIRENGFKGIIWVPGSGWQSWYDNYAKYPINDPEDNFGYAVHCYPGWYNSGSGKNDNTDKETMRRQFETQVPVVKTNPVIVTEIDWSPVKPGEGHYDEHGNWVEPNYGTWGTATTSGFGNAFKYIHDYYGNVSMVLQGSGLYFDIDEYINSGNVVPAFAGVDEACGEACFKWYKEFYEAQTSGINSIVDDTQSNQPAKYYDLQGRPLGSNYHGICIIKSEGMARKAIK
ncbi:MAG: cellulase family glycosylhydrolase [Prevotella sp.]